MSLSNLYFRGCFEQPSQEQIDAVEAITGGDVEGNVVDRSCNRTDLNTCGMSIQKLFDTYPIYSTQKGLYKTWGEIQFPWEISPLTPDLLFEITDDKWSVGTYRRATAYPQGSKVLLIEEDGYQVSLYQANQDIVSISGAFDYSKWTRVCKIETTIPAGLPTIEEIKERYPSYLLEYFYREWEEVDTTWSEGTYELSLQNCQSQTTTISDFEKCVKGSSSDIWGNTRVRKQFFYRKGDIVFVENECKDAVCLWIANQDIPANEQVFNQYNYFNPGIYWQKIYCVNTGKNKCLEYQRKKEPSLGYDVVQIGSLGHIVEVPVPYRLKPTTLNLEEKAQQRPSPVVLTQEQIDALNQPTEE